MYHYRQSKSVEPIDYLAASRRFPMLSHVNVLEIVPAPVAARWCWLWQQPCLSFLCRSSTLRKNKLNRHNAMRQCRNSSSRITFERNQSTNNNAEHSSPLFLFFLLFLLLNGGGGNENKKKQQKWKIKKEELEGEEEEKKRRQKNKEDGMGLRRKMSINSELMNKSWIW